MAKPTDPSKVAEWKRKLSDSHKGQTPWCKGGHLSEDTKRKISESLKGKYTSEETRKKLSDSLKGKNKGKHHSEEQRKKMSEALKGRRLSEDHKKKLSEAKKGKHLSEEHKMKLSEAKKGRPGPWLGKHISEEHKKKLSEAAKNRTPQYRSKGEKELVSFIKSIYNGVILENDRELLNGWELDVYLPELKLAFEYNGDFWHSLLEKRDRDVQKIIRCHAKGIELFHIWESDWKHNNQETKNFIAETIRG